MRLGAAERWSHERLHLPQRSGLRRIRLPSPSSRTRCSLRSSPSSGPRLGNTSIVLHGSHFLTPATPTPALQAAVSTYGLDFRCKFGVADAHHIVTATLVNDSTLRCTSPPRELLFEEPVLKTWHDLNFTFNDSRWASARAPRAQPCIRTSPSR